MNPPPRSSIRIELRGPVKSPRGERIFDVETGEDGMTVEALLRQGAGFPPEDLATLAVVSKGARLRLRDRVPPGALLEVILPAGGG